MDPRPRLRPEDVLASDYGRLRGELARLEREAVPADAPRREAWRQAVAASMARREARAALVPTVALDGTLPIAREGDRITALIREHPVVVVAGETGSGKTTQLPKLCLAAGRGVRGLVGCTQPRRIAARAVARRVAQELGTEVGGLVGWQVRFTEQVGPDTLIKFMTDGILLAETQGDPWLSRYDTLIVDEAHERSLNIDFLLGYLKRLLAKRRDLRLVVTSATIDIARFAAHFDGAPVVDVEGRTFPVEVRWRPPQAPVEEAPARPTRDGKPQRPARGRERGDEADPIVEVIDEITRTDPLGDVLVFLPGEREIRDLHLALERRRYRETDVLPLYARLSVKDQDRVFNPGVKRRIVLATNVAETSLTVPRIRHVVDPGTARVNRWSHRHKVQRLHIEPVSQAAADQRKGRCGRVGPGICWRLYDEADYARRPRFTDPELLRSSLAGVILRLLSLKLGGIEDFPFIDPPEPRAIADGWQQLLELGAITPDRRGLTDTGRAMARLPIDVALARMLVEAQRLRCLRDMTVLAAFLSVQDPRERPAEARELADAAHAHHADPRSDFVGILNLWDDYRVAHEDLTQSKLREWCQARFLSFLRMREWRELHRQLLLLCGELGWALEERGAPPAPEKPFARRVRGDDAPVRGALSRPAYEALHRALLSGLPANVGRRDEKREYVGTRGRRYSVFPGSALAKKPPDWLLSATLLDTQRLYALTNAEVEPAWIEQQAAHLTKQRHFDPHWARSQGRVLGYQSVTLLGLTIIERRRVAFERIDPVAAHAVFVREALIPSEIDCRAAFVGRNLAVLDAARAEEAKRRRHGLVKPDEELVAWLAPRIPGHICSTVALDAWYKALDAESRRSLEWTLDDVLVAEASPERAFPKSIRIGGHALALEYRFEPNHPADGVTLVLPLALLNAVPAARLTWLVPGLLTEKVAELIRGLPKTLRRNFVPAPDFARAFVESVRDSEPHGALLPALCAHLSRISGVEVAPTDFDEPALPAHLRFNVRLLDERAHALAESRDLDALRAQHGARAREQFARETATAIARDGVAKWDFGDLPESIATDTGLAAFPALVDAGADCAIRVFERHDEADAAHAAGVRRLARIALEDKLRGARRNAALSPKVAIAYTTIDSPDRLREDVTEAAFDDLVRGRCAPVRDRPAFDALVAEASKQLGPTIVRRLALVDEVLREYAALLPLLEPPLLGFARANYDDLREQLRGLVHPGFARELPLQRLSDLPRFLKGMALRTQRLQQDPRRDQARMIEAQGFATAREALAARGADPAALDRLRWLIEEYRVQLFAQELKTREPVSEKRLRKLLADLDLQTDRP
ncbi:MAG: ATP-dependent RNA helicase HrpA [Pseudomonadota bacterium]